MTSVLEPLCCISCNSFSHVSKDLNLWSKLFHIEKSKAQIDMNVPVKLIKLLSSFNLKLAKLPRKLILILIKYFNTKELENIENFLLNEGTHV